VYIYLDDLNDNCPEFAQGASYSGIVIETADIGDQVLEVYASDLDYDVNAAIRFSIESTTADPMNLCEYTVLFPFSLSYIF
jgi:hypothetical protein